MDVLLKRLADDDAEKAELRRQIDANSQYQASLASKASAEAAERQRLAASILAWTQTFTGTDVFAKLTAPWPGQKEGPSTIVLFTPAMVATSPNPTLPGASVVRLSKDNKLSISAVQTPLPVRSAILVANGAPPVVCGTAAELAAAVNAEFLRAFVSHLASDVYACLADPPV